MSQQATGGNRKIRFIAVAPFTLLFALCVSAGAQQPNKIPRVGFVTAGSRSTIAARIAAFRQGLRELGYVEDKNVVIEWRFGQRKPDRLPGRGAWLRGAQ